MPVGHVMSGRGHGRAERRTIQVLPAPEGIWPYARQVFLVERYVYDLSGTLTSAVAALGLTALTAAQAGPQRLNWLVRDHRGIEAMHWLRDMDFDEDRSRLCRGSAPQIMAGIRNLAIGLIHASGRTKVAPTLRWVACKPTRALIFLCQST